MRTALADITLRWMQDKASALGLALTPVKADPENYSGPFADSYTDFLKGFYANKKRRHYRSIGVTKFGHEVIDDSVLKRRRSTQNTRRKTRASEAKLNGEMSASPC